MSPTKPMRMQKQKQSKCSASSLKLVFVGGAPLEFPKNLPCSPCNNTKQLKKERFLLWMEEFSSSCFPGSPYQYGDGSSLVSAQSQVVPRSCSITVFGSSGSSRNPLQISWSEKLQILELHLRNCCWGNCCWRHFISLENSDLSKMLSKVKHVLRQRMGSGICHLEIKTRAALMWSNIFI